jgi:ribonuclease E
MANPAPNAAAQDAEPATANALGAEPTFQPSAPARAEVEVRAKPEPPPATDEPPRPRRSGWWQRARASVIGK